MHEIGLMKRYRLLIYSALLVSAFFIGGIEIRSRYFEPYAAQPRESTHLIRNGRTLPPDLIAELDEIEVDEGQEQSSPIAIESAEKSPSAVSVFENPRSYFRSIVIIYEHAHNGEKAGESIFSIDFEKALFRADTEEAMFQPKYEIHRDGRHYSIYPTYGKMSVHRSPGTFDSIATWLLPERAWITEPTIEQQEILGRTCGLKRKLFREACFWKGIPLSTTFADGRSFLAISIEENKALPANLFDIPSGYEVKNYTRLPVQ